MVLYHLLPNKLCESSLLPASNPSSAEFPVPWPLLPQHISLSTCKPLPEVLKPAAISCSFLSCSGHSPDSPAQEWALFCPQQTAKKSLHCFFLPMVEHHFCVRSMMEPSGWRLFLTGMQNLIVLFTWEEYLPTFWELQHTAGPVCKLHTHLSIEQKWTTFVDTFTCTYRKFAFCMPAQLYLQQEFPQASRCTNCTVGISLAIQAFFFMIISYLCKNLQKWGLRQFLFLLVSSVTTRCHIHSFPVICLYITSRKQLPASLCECTDHTSLGFLCLSVMEKDPWIHVSVLIYCP